MIAKQLRVKGIAIRPGISRNGINYSSEELQKFSSTLTNRPILVDHKSDDITKNVGIINNAYSSNDGVVYYEGWVKENGQGIIERIKDKRLKEVSIGAMVGKLVKENDNDDTLTAVDMEGMELSIVSCPGIRGTSLQQSLNSISKKMAGEKVNILPIVESINTFSDNKEVEEDSKMAEEEVPKEEPVATEEPKEEVTEEPKEEEKEEEEAPAEEVKEEPAEEKKESVKLDVGFDNSKLDETISKMEKIASLKEKLKSETKEKTTKGKVVKEEKTEVKEDSDYVVEDCEYSNGVSLWKQPKADGSYL